MSFYQRDKETEQLRSIERLSATEPQLTVISGRKRIGKTALLRDALGGRIIPVVYFFVERKNEHLLCNDVMRIASSWLNVDLQASSSFADLLGQLIDQAASINYTLIIDECQNLLSINAGIFDQIADIWRANKNGKKINLILCGSNHSQMTKIFDDDSAPFATLIDHRIHLAPFPITTLKQILAEHNPSYSTDDLLAFAMITGGVASYVRELVGNNAFTRDDIFRTVLSDGSMFITEGRDMLIEELGRDSQTYFSILYAISEGKATRNEITSAIGVECGGYLDKLERIYGLIRRHRPYLQPDNTRNVRYGLRDNFLSFWFRYIYRHRSAVEFGDYSYVMQKINEDYSAYSETMLKKYFRQLYRESGEYDIVVDYWEKGGENSIDLIAVDKEKQHCVIANCLFNSQQADLDELKARATILTDMQPQYTYDIRILGTKDM
ncbi:MAG: ATP-binding protein [Bacteroidales bacterium]|nr:ATP-binding protein [Bacteroidales bacterium]